MPVSRAGGSPAFPTVEDWVEQYLRAWRSNEPDDIRALFTQDAEYHETPYETHWIGRAAIVKGWRSRWNWQQGGWTFDWQVVSPGQEQVVVEGVGLGNFSNVWTLEFAPDGRCRRFHMVNQEITG